MEERTGLCLVDGLVRVLEGHRSKYQETRMRCPAELHQIIVTNATSSLTLTSMHRFMH